MWATKQDSNRGSKVANPTAKTTTTQRVSRSFRDSVRKKGPKLPKTQGKKTAAQERIEAHLCGPKKTKLGLPNRGQRELQDRTATRGKRRMWGWGGSVELLWSACRSCLLIAQGWLRPWKGGIYKTARTGRQGTPSTQPRGGLMFQLDPCRAVWLFPIGLSDRLAPPYLTVWSRSIDCLIGLSSPVWMGFRCPQP